MCPTWMVPVMAGEAKLESSTAMMALEGAVPRAAVRGGTSSPTLQGHVMTHSVEESQGHHISAWLPQLDMTAARENVVAPIQNILHFELCMTLTVGQVATIQDPKGWGDGAGRHA